MTREEVKETPEPCEDAISRLDVVNMLAHHAAEISNDAFLQMVEELDEEPTVQPTRIKARWLKREYLTGGVLDTQFACSNCGYESGHMHGWTYCPHCGAEMRMKE